MTQPTLSVTSHDVQRIIQRDFPQDRWTEVQTVLSRYGHEKWHGETNRVHLAILKLAGGDVDRLKQNTDMACTDYRDVLSPAEYRRYSEIGWFDNGDPKVKQQAIRDDWDEYQSWLQSSTLSGE